MEKRTSAITVGAGQYVVNKDHIVISEPTNANVVDIQQSAIAVKQILHGRHIAVYGMGAFVKDEENPETNNLAPNATLVNDGIIEIHLSELVKAYKDKVQTSNEDKEHKFRFIKCFAMAAGKNSLLINNGTIKIYFDYDIEDMSPIYGETIVAEENSTVINNGEIQLIGNGSVTTQTRAIAVPANNVKIINNGSISVKLERAATVRVLATTGANCFLGNFGKIDINSTGRIMTIGRLSDTPMVNTGEINIVSRAKYIENKVSFLFQSYPLACAFYEHELPNDLPVMPIINEGKIKIHLEGSEESTEHAVAFGIYSELVGEEKQLHVFENTGSIEVTKSGPFDFVTAELGCNVQSKKDFPYDIEIRRWTTKKRDFKATKDLFVAGSGRFDLSNAEITTPDGEVLSKDGAVFQNAEQAKRGDTVTIK
jgi:hypothetical protein